MNTTLSLVLSHTPGFFQIRPKEEKQVKKRIKWKWSGEVAGDISATGVCLQSSSSERWVVSPALGWGCTWDGLKDLVVQGCPKLI